MSNDTASQLLSMSISYKTTREGSAKNLRCSRTDRNHRPALLGGFHKRVERACTYRLRTVGHFVLGPSGDSSVCSQAACAEVCRCFNASFADQS